MRCTLPVWGAKTGNRTVRTGDVLSAGVFCKKKKTWQKKVPWKLLFPPKTNFGTSPHPKGTKLKAEPHVFMYDTSTLA
jgi:hypothetical protein